LKFYEKGLGTAAIARKLGITSPTVSHHLRKLSEHGLARVQEQNRAIDWSLIQKSIDAGMKHREICKEHRIAVDTLSRAYKKGFVTRPKRVFEMTLTEYCESWTGRRATSAFRRTVRKKLLDRGIPERCAVCGLEQWRGQKAPLEVDHIDGNASNNKPTNLRLLCLHCHSQTETWRGRNVK